MRILYWIILSVALAYGSAHAQTDCLIHQPLPSFEQVMGYEIGVADDGTQFKPAEKHAFDQVAATLPEFYRHMPTLQKFERVPDGYVIVGGAYGAAGEYSASGWRIGNRTRINGIITLVELPLTTANGRLTGFFYHTLVHEMSHAYDYQLHEYSHSTEWTGLSEWNSDGTGTSSNFYSDYARSNPNEDFAESMAAFVLDADTLLAKAPTKFELISRKFYGGRRFDTATLLAGYQAQLQGLSGSARAAKIAELRRTDYYACAILK